MRPRRWLPRLTVRRKPRRKPSSTRSMPTPAGSSRRARSTSRAAPALSWMFAEWIIKGHPSLLGALSGAVAGLVAVTPAAGYAGPMGAIVLGLVVGIVCLFFCTVIKNALGYDDSLDVFGVHCIG